MSTQFLTVTDGTIAYEVEGSGPLIICSPSMGDLRQEYRFLVPLLVKAGYKVAWMDVRGHGESSTGWADVSVAGVGSDMLALIRHLDAGAAVLLGASMSAGAAVWAAAEEPSLVRGIVLLGPFARNNPIGSNPKTAGLFKTLFTLLFSRPWGPALWQRYYASLYPARKPDDLNAYIAGLRDNLSKPGRQEALIGMIRADKLASEERLGRVTAPALVLMGGRDPDFKDPAAEAEWLAGVLHGRAHVFPAAGHYPQAEFPAETAAVILAFLSALG